MTALVTGCAGFIGSQLTDALLENGEAVLGVDCFNENYGRRQKLRNLARCLSGRSLDISYAGRQRGDVRDTGADITRARMSLGFEPRTALSDGLRAQFEWVSDELVAA